jgi:membrane-associated protease RseP (regulator of RpoE activity)
MFVTYVLCFVLALFIHEVAHSLAAYACRVPISEFGLGWGPRVFSVRWRNVEYIFRALPFGGFVRFDLIELQKRPLQQQILVMMAGVIGNLLAGLLPISAVFTLTNYVLAATNILPLYQQDGWKCGMLMLRGLLKRKSTAVEWVFTIAGSVLSFVVIAVEVFRRFER